VWHGIEDAGKKIWTTLEDWQRKWDSYKQTWIQWGKDVLAGFLDGLSQAWAAGPQKFWAWANAFLDGILTIFGIHSPSTVFYGYAFDVIQGFFNGLTAAWAGFSAAITGVGTNIGTAIVNGIINAIKAGVNSVASWVQWLVGQAQSAANGGGGGGKGGEGGGAPAPQRGNAPSAGIPVNWNGDPREQFNLGRANGGPISPMGRYQVNERGPEAIQAGQAGYIYNAGETTSMMRDFKAMTDSLKINGATFARMTADLGASLGSVSSTLEQSVKALDMSPGRQVVRSASFNPLTPAAAGTPSAARPSVSVVISSGAIRVDNTGVDDATVHEIGNAVLEAVIDVLDRSNSTTTGAVSVLQPGNV
jgi:hypothetical protein